MMLGDCSLDPGGIAPVTVSYLIVAGGGFGSIRGGGGAGGLLEGTCILDSSINNITVGAGGNYGNGGNSLLNGIIAYGGGYGGINAPASNGGSGGGRHLSNAYGLGILGQGHNGSPDIGTDGAVYPASNGGGAGVTDDGVLTYTRTGRTSSITGTSTVYATGGKGYTGGSTIANTGNGGNGAGLLGASGIVVVKVPLAMPSVGGTIILSVPGYRIHKFTNVGASQLILG